ncbi:MAG: DUF4157 domain-containing protein [Spirulina sp. SIO3F2]|nr:DUF4157 domain-containing protein [Spirulina sp. SIO3F2]
MNSRKRQYTRARKSEATPAQSKTQTSQYSRPFPKPQPLQPRTEQEELMQPNQGVQYNALTLPIMPKLTVGAANDKYEQEADAMAAQVVQQLNNPPVQRQEYEDKKLDRLQRQSLVQSIQRTDTNGEGTASPELEQSIQQEQGKGQPLADNIRQPMENAFGTSFDGVRIHTDSNADALNQSIQAKAFTTGQDIFFRQGVYAPESQSGQELLAHELTHVVQQNSPTVQCQANKIVQRQITDGNGIIFSKADAVKILTYYFKLQNIEVTQDWLEKEINAYAEDEKHTLLAISTDLMNKISGDQGEDSNQNTVNLKDLILAQNNTLINHDDEDILDLYNEGSISVMNNATDIDNSSMNNDAIFDFSEIPHVSDMIATTAVEYSPTAPRLATVLKSALRGRGASHLERQVQVYNEDEDISDLYDDEDSASVINDATDIDDLSIDDDATFDISTINNSTNIDDSSINNDAIFDFSEMPRVSEARMTSPLSSFLEMMSRAYTPHIPDEEELLRFHCRYPEPITHSEQEIEQMAEEDAMSLLFYSWPYMEFHEREEILRSNQYQEILEWQISFFSRRNALFETKEYQELWKQAMDAVKRRDFDEADRIWDLVSELWHKHWEDFR